MTMTISAVVAAFSLQHGRGHIMLRRRLFHLTPTTTTTTTILIRHIHNDAVGCSRRRSLTMTTATATMRRLLSTSSSTHITSTHQHPKFSFSTSTASKSRSVRNSIIAPPPTTTTATARNDWREWFRSSDYDDPWSPYYAFQEPTRSTATTNTTTIMAKHRETYQKTIVPSVMLGMKLNDGVGMENMQKKEGERTIVPWQRRRFGMNLEPITLIFRGANVIDIDNKKMHYITNTSQGAAEEGGMEAILLEKAQERMRRIDAQTRFLCRMLDDLYRAGIWRESDRPTLERCHRTIGRILTMTPEDSPRGNNTNASQQPGMISFTGLAQRAGAILQRMELCTPPLPPLSPRQVADNIQSEPFVSSRSSYQGAYSGSSISPHLLHTKFALPTPTREIYNMVLLSYTKEVGPLHVAQQAEDMVWSMIVRARTQQIQLPSSEGQEKKDESTTTNATADNKRTDALLPSRENWNCVLKCWSKSTDPLRSFYAYSFLLSWIEWDKQYQALLDKDTPVHESNPNAESYRIVLYSCLVDDSRSIAEITSHHGKSTQDMESLQRAKQIGSGVAIHLWKVLQKFENDSVTYRTLVQAICQTSELPTTVSTSKSLSALARVYTNCCKDGMLTDEISNLVEAATTKSQFAQLQSMVDPATSASSA